MSEFNKILEKYRRNSFSERDKGAKFENLMKRFLQVTPLYTGKFKNVWLWNEFPYRNDLGGKDSGIDLVAETVDGDFWAVQCKCYAEDAYINKPAVDSFLATSSREFTNGESKTVRFSNRLWISTTNKWNSEAEKAIQNQNPPLNRISLYDLESAPIDWEKLDVYGKKVVEKKSLYKHQTEAIAKSHQYFTEHNRGKLIMACGTGKTFTSLKLVENETNGKGLILFLVPSIALLGQTLREWAYQADEELNPFCVCSDPAVSQQKTNDDDTGGYSITDLAVPATTNIDKVADYLKAVPLKQGMSVIFSTYQSIEVISKAQEKVNSLKGESCVFDFIVCDEAHRTTGITVKGADDSAFVKVHDNDFLVAKKRLYMTATPRLYREDAKQKAKEAEAFLCSMDDVAIYGDEIYRIGFGKAVDNNLLSDYKVLILTISDKEVTPILKKIQDNSENPKEISTDDVSKLVGCINALSKRMLIDKGLLKDSDPNPMHRAVAFCQNIKISKKIANLMNIGKDDFYNTLSPEVRAETVSIEADHVDGGMNAPTREEKLSWLKSTPESGMDCRMLCNVRCLSEGVDVPTLDAVLFLSARNSQIDVVQSVGRVMRTAPNKKYGYIIIPILVPPDVKPEEALDDNDRFKVVWTVLNALRAHDDRFDAYINKIELNKKKQSGGGRIIIGGSGPRTGTGTTPTGDELPPTQRTLLLEYDQLKDAIYARMVLKVGNKHYWEQWAKDIGEINERIVRRIREAIKTGAGAREFKKFVESLKENINPSVSEESATEMLSQHIITRPVFEALFENYSFAKSNPVSQSMQKMLEILDGEYLDADLQKMEGFYESVKMTVSGIDNIAGKQKIIVDLYDKFFKTALPKTVEKLGIVYTPIEVVDFILNSVEDVLKKEFNRSLTDENVNILDPFTGTGTFISRLITSGIIKPKDLLRKYTKELHANEIVLLAYYIASINIENAFHDTRKDNTNYQSFEGICLTDTFQLGESDGSDELKLGMFPENSKRVRSQKKQPLRIIIGNPPYSIGQKTANDNAQNQEYPRLNEKITNTYVKESSANLKKGLYDSYIKAFRWATDRLDPNNGGIVAFVSNAGWLDGNAMDGFRKCIEKEFSVIYVFNLRGNGRTSGERCRQEGEPLFAAHGGTGGSLTPIAITLLVKKPNHTGKAQIHYHDIGMYLKRKEKLARLEDYKSILSPKVELTSITPNEDGDWLNQRNETFQNFIPIAPEKKFDEKSKSFFTTYAIGLATNRDSWVYNYSIQALEANVKRMLNFYDMQRKEYLKEIENNGDIKLENFIDTNPKNISWTVNLKKSLESKIGIPYVHNSIVHAIYRPFTKQNLYLEKSLIERPGLSKKLFPTPQSKNLVICIQGIGSNKEFSVLLVNHVPDLQLQFNGQCFPLYWYEEKENSQGTLFDSTEQDHTRHEAISDFILQRCRMEYGPRVTKEDIFYYVYGLLHSPVYKETFSADLKKMLPRIPLVKDFWEFSKAGRELADIHLNYENQPVLKDLEIQKTGENFKVDKIRFPKKEEKETIIYNSNISIHNIPLEAYNYVVNGKSPIEWIMERYQVKIDEKSNIENNPNLWCKENGNDKYIFNLLLSVITTSVITLKIVKNLPDITEELS